MEIEYKNNEYKTDFVFSDCIKRMDYSPVKESLEKKARLFSFLPFVKKRIKGKIEDIELLQQATDKKYRFLDWFFSEMASQNYCKATHTVYKKMPSIFASDHEEMHSVWINGEGFEEFEINGKPEFSISNDRKERETRVPILEGSQEAKLILFDYPKCDLPLFGKILVEYDFSTRFYIGDYWEKRPDGFTSNPLKTEDFAKIKMYYGKPGSVYYRLFDRTDEELDKSVMPFCGRERFEMEGKIYAGQNLFYQGNMDSTGTFPFFIRKDKERDRDKSRVPKVPASEPVMAG